MEFPGASFVNIGLCADLDNDGYLDLIIQEIDTHYNADILYMSKISKDGTFYFKKITRMVYTG